MARYHIMINDQVVMCPNGDNGDNDDDGGNSDNDGEKGKITMRSPTR